METTANWNSAVLCKTPKALEELSERRYGLRPKARQVLVLLDGTRTLSTLTELISAPDLQQIVRELLRDGFLSSEANHLVSEAPAITAVSAFPQDAPIDPVRLTRAKAYLIEISQQHLGLMAAKLQQEIAGAHDRPSVRAALAHWNMALRESRSGAGIATPCLQKAREILDYTG